MTSNIDSRGFHIAWSEVNSQSPFNNETYYARALSNDNDPTVWYDYKEVTDESGVTGWQPTIALSASKVHVGFYQEYTPYFKVRDYNWQTQTWTASNGSSVSPLRVYSISSAVVGNTVHMIARANDPFARPYKISHFKRDVDGTTWTLVTDRVGDDFYDNNAWPPQIVSTADGKLHIFYDKYGSSEGCYHRIFDGTSWSANQAPSDMGGFVNAFPIAVGNDIYYSRMAYTDFDIGYRQYDAAPIKPQNLRITNTSSGPIQLAWAANPEPDISLYQVWRNVVNEGSGWQSIATTTSTSYTDQDYMYAFNFGNERLQYKIRAKDNSNNLSVYSDIASTTGEPNFRTPQGEQQATEQVATEVPTTTALQPNYPNPFNPTTTIRFTIQDVGFTTLKVYDILGREVATLLSEVKNPGTYDVLFDGTNLTSGMYFVRLTVQEKVFTQRISLMK